MLPRQADCSAHPLSVRNCRAPEHSHELLAGLLGLKGPSLQPGPTASYALPVFVVTSDVRIVGTGAKHPAAALEPLLAACC